MNVIKINQHMGGWGVTKRIYFSDKRRPEEMFLISNKKKTRRERISCR
jgi:hypothetical protein